jgi:hypothetical protein
VDKIRLGNAIKEGKGHRGWFAGYFIENNDLLKTNDVEINYDRLKKGDRKAVAKANKTATTIDVLISGKIKFTFPESGKEVLIENEGDYVCWGPGISHTWESVEDSLSIVVRWPSIPGDQI